jgi:hypothetical protein
VNELGELWLVNQFIAERMLVAVAAPSVSTRMWLAGQPACCKSAWNAAMSPSPP